MYPDSKLRKVKKIFQFNMCVNLCSRWLSGLRQNKKRPVFLPVVSLILYSERSRLNKLCRHDYSRDNQL